MLFCTDLDGTLYNDEKTVSKQNLDAIEYFKSEGGLFTFITGRVPATSKDICSISYLCKVENNQIVPSEKNKPKLFERLKINEYNKSLIFLNDKLLHIIIMF